MWSASMLSHTKAYRGGKALRLRSVCQLTSASPATIWRWAKSDPHFPRPFRLSAGVTAWDEAEILDWLEAKKATRDER
ncbi:MAG: helix-turn-helix transcriptional regulator [Croceibacterium sp.]